MNGYAIRPVFEWQVFSPQNHVAAHGRRTEQPAEKASVFGHGLDLLAAPHRLVHVDKANHRLVQPLVAVGEIALRQVEEGLSAVQYVVDQCAVKALLPVLGLQIKNIKAARKGVLA